MSEKINFDYTKMTPFKWFIIENYPFLEDSIDGVNNYQLLVKLGDEINKNRDTINELGLNAEALTEGYNSLVDYVDNYFENLDVQDEINEKLDEMAENGTLTNLISAYLDPKINAQNQNINNFINTSNAKLNTMKNEVQNIISQFSSIASGSPLVASSVSEMTDTSRVYVNTTDGHWYWYDGDSWKDGGVYQSTEIANGSIEERNIKYNFLNDLKKSIPSFTLTRGYWNSNNVPTITDSDNFKYSSPIQLKKGQTIRVNACGYNTYVSIIVEVSSEGNPINSLCRSVETGQRYYEYTAQTDMYVSISGRTIVSSGDILECSIKYNLIDNKYINEIESIEPINQSNLLNENDYYLSQSATKSYNNINYGLIKKELELTINASSVSYNYLFYAMKRFSLGSFTKDNIKNVVACVEIKGEPIKGLYLTVRGDNGVILTTNVKDSNITVKGLKADEYTKYYINIPYNSGVNFTNLFVGVGCGTSQTLTDAKLYIRYIGIKINSNELDLRVNPFTIYDYKDQLQKEVEVDQLFTAFNKFGVIGDSLASGECVATSGGSYVYVDNYDYSWGQFIARKYGMTCINFSSGGLTTRSWLGAPNGLTKLQLTENKCNAYICGLGVNDVITLGSNYLGTSSDIHVEDYTQNADTFYGNYGKIISNIKIIQPKAKIFLLTIPETGATYNSFNNAIRTIATLFDNVYIIDLASNNLSDFSSGFIHDNIRQGHYNAITYSYIADILYNELSNYMYNNYSDFSQIEFIGTDYEYTN